MLWKGAVRLLCENGGDTDTLEDDEVDEDDVAVEFNTFNILLDSFKLTVKLLCFGLRGPLSC